MIIKHNEAQPLELSDDVNENEMFSLCRLVKLKSDKSTAGQVLRKWELRYILIGVQSGRTTLEGHLAVFTKTENPASRETLTPCPSGSSWQHYLR